MTDHLPCFCKFKLGNVHNCMLNFYSTGCGLRDRDKGSAVSHSHEKSDIRKVKLYNTLDQKRNDFKNTNTFLVDSEEKSLQIRNDLDFY